MAPNPRRPTTTVFAKTTRPEIASIVAREALYVRLDGPSTRTVAWITGPAGSGKSTLAASYVAARNYRAAWYQVDRDDDEVETFFNLLGHAAQHIGVAEERLPVLDATARLDLAAYARAFFRRLFAEGRAGAAIVIDNLDIGAADSPLRRCVESGLTQVPRHCAVLVTSRSEPPPGLARMRANGEMVVVAADDLRLSADELEALAQLRGRPLSSADARILHERTQGWAAAAVLMLEHAKMTGQFATLPADAAPAVLFDYLAGEVFDRFEPSAREALLRIACLQRVTPEVAVAVTGDARAARLLLNLSHNDYFVREVIAGEQRVYTLHPLYREFLLRVAARDRPELIAPAALAHAAQAMQAAGLQEDAVALLLQAGQWGPAAALVVEQADALLAAGRRSTLLGWLERVPPATLQADAGLLCADAACRLDESPRAARQRYEQAWRVCRDRDDAPGRLRACAGIVEAIVAECDDLATLDNWLPELEALLDAGVDAAHPAWTTLMAARWLREPADAGFLRWSRQGSGTGQAALGVRDHEALALRRVATLLRGDLPAADALAAQGRASDAAPRDVARLRTLDAFHGWIDGDLDAAAQALAGLDDAADGIGRASVRRALLRAALALAREDEGECARALEPLAGRALRRGERALLLVAQSALAALRRESSLALREARGALNVSIEAGLPWAEALARLALAQALAAVGDRPGAQAQVSGAEDLARRLGSAPIGCSALLVRAAIAFEEGDEAQAVAALRQGLVTLRDLGARQVVGLAPGALAALMSHALRLGIEVEHAHQIVRRLGLRPPAQAQRLRRWAWRFDLCTLGGFELLRDGRPIEFSAKGPGRPLELLKVLVAYGARHVRVDELTDALWPHVDGDYAYKSFTATLHRLRRLLGDDDAVLLREGRLSLNPTMFWVDAWAFDHLAAEIDASRDAQSPSAQIQALVGELVALYRGPFLPDEAEQSAYLARREQLRARLLRALAQAWPADDAPRPNAEVDAYARCVQADELCEAFHRELMLAWLRRGDASRAAATYQHLRTLLAARLRTQPSPETQAVYQDVVARTAAAAR